jgi:hypothetical protein
MEPYAVGKVQATTALLVHVSATQGMIIALPAHVQFVVICLGLLLIALDLQQQ